MGVPIRNVYYLLCYAWDWLEARTLVSVDALQGNRVENLLGKVLEDGVTHLIRGGLDRGYVTRDEEERRIRGKVLLLETMGRCLLQQGRVLCTVDDLSHDVAHNRVIKAAMTAMLDVESLDNRIAVGLRNHCRRLHDVSDVPLSAEAFRQVQLHRNVARYGFLMNVARLVAECFMPDVNTGELKFHPFTASEQAMGSLFERFVRNFLRREQDDYSVSAVKVPWDLDSAVGSDPSWLPEMRTDITLSSPPHRVVIETKFYATTHQSHHGGRTLISSHLYQLLTYLNNLSAHGGGRPVGVLLYAGSGLGVPLQYRIGGHIVLIRNIDLNCEWEQIHRSLLNLTKELSAISADLVPPRAVRALS